MSEISSFFDTDIIMEFGTKVDNLLQFWVAKSRPLGAIALEVLGDT